MDHKTPKGRNSDQFMPLRWLRHQNKEDKEAEDNGGAMGLSFEDRPVEAGSRNMHTLDSNINHYDFKH